MYEGTGGTGWYGVAIMLEDYSQSTTDFNAVSPFSSIGLQFLVNIISYSGSCYRKPYFTGSTPAADSCIEIKIGSTYRAFIAVKHVDSARRYIISEICQKFIVYYRPKVTSNTICNKTFRGSQPNLIIVKSKTSENPCFNLLLHGLHCLRVNSCRCKAPQHDNVFLWHL